MNLSIWMMTKDCEKYLPGALDSVSKFVDKLSADEWEIVIVDGYSTDRTLENIVQFISGYPENVRFMQNKDGIESSMRQAILSTRGKYVISCQSDERLLDGMHILIEHMAAERNSKDVVAVIGDMMLVCDAETNGSIKEGDILDIERFDLAQVMRLQQAPPFASSVFWGDAIRSSAVNCPPFCNIETFIWLYLAHIGHIEKTNVASAIFGIRDDQKSKVEHEAIMRNRQASVEYVKNNMPPFCNGNFA